MISTFAGPTIKIKEFRESFIQMFKERVKNTLCELSKGNNIIAKTYLKFAKAINQENEKIVPIRQKFTNAMVMALKPEKPVTPQQIGWYAWASNSNQLFLLITWCFIIFSAIWMQQATF